MNQIDHVFAKVSSYTVEAVETESFPDFFDARYLLKDQSAVSEAFLQLLVRYNFASAVLKFHHHYGEALKI